MSRSAEDFRNYNEREASVADTRFGSAEECPPVLRPPHYAYHDRALVRAVLRQAQVLADCLCRLVFFRFCEDILALGPSRVTYFLQLFISFKERRLSR